MTNHNFRLKLNEQYLLIMHHLNHFWIQLVVFNILVLFFLGCNQQTDEINFKSEWHSANRIWLGPDYWANPMQDWKVVDGRVECITSGGDRNMFLLTYEIDSSAGSFNSSVELGALDNPLTEGWVGFKVGIKGEFKDFRDNAVRGEGMPVGITNEGRLFIGYIDSEAPTIDPSQESIHLQMEATEASNGRYQITLQVVDGHDEVLATYNRVEIDNQLITGGIALTCSAYPPLEVKDERQMIEYPDWGTEENTDRTGNFRFWFKDWQLSGSKIRHYPERSFGPILFTQFTVSENVLKLTAQMPPLGAQDSNTATLEIQSNNTWLPVDTSTIDPMSRTATFKYSLSEDYEDTPYRVTYRWEDSNGEPTNHYFEGSVPQELDDHNQVVVAAFTGNNDLGFPNSDLVNSVTQQNPDFLFFSGDQIYEGVGGYGAQRAPVEMATIDYLRKWYMFGWTYRELLRNTPSVAIPDDHDVYHGNIWGESGKAADTSLETHHEQQDTGGYKMHPDWVNMVQTTQTSHLPEAYDTTPVKQGIGVYYTNIEYGGISFAVIEDRKFKSAPKALLPDGDIHNGWYQNPDFDPVTQADHPQAALLGERQHQFLNWWSKDWGPDTWMKVLLSQTIFANVATLPRADVLHDNVVPQLRILKTGEYAPDDIPAADMDSNGWPQSGRNEAIKIIRKAFAFHIAGDQHLGSTIQYGVDEYGDSGYSICVPSVSNVFPRRWYPNPSTKINTGNFKDGFGNKITVLAVSNPAFTGRKPAKLYDRATGYGIVRFARDDRSISIENWPRDATPGVDLPYEGWPILIKQSDNYKPVQGAYLPLLKYQGPGEPLVQAFNVHSELVWTIRLSDNQNDLKVPNTGEYLLRVSLNTQTKDFKVQATRLAEDRGETLLSL